MTRTLLPVPRWLCAAMPLAALVFPGCGSGGIDNGNTENPGGGGPPGDPGSGGGPGAPGGSGNPLAIVLDFSVHNEASAERTETIRASVPFPRGGYPSLDNLVVSGFQTAWLPLQYWPDGTVKVAQAQFTDTLAAGQQKTYQVARDEAALTGSFTRNSWVGQLASSIEIGAEVQDTFLVPYRSFVDGGIASSGGEVLQSTALVQTKRYRTFHTVVAGQTGIGRDYLTSTYYVTEFRDAPFVLVDWILGNDYLGIDTVPTGNSDPNLRALGTVDVRAARFLCKGVTAMPYLASSEGIDPAATVGGGYTSFQVMQETYLTDAQTRRYRFLLRCEPPGAQPTDLARWQATASAMSSNPLYALASQPAFEQTASAGLIGGPIPGPADAEARAESEYWSWQGQNWFGTWGSHGDVMPTATTGTPRNGPMSPNLAHAIQGQKHKLLQVLEQKAWAQAMRPYHLYGLQVGADENILLWEGTPYLAVPGETLGRKALRDNDPHPQYRSLSVGQPRAHGWGHFDHEHWSCDLLFDYYTVSGDAWAREELRQLGQSLKGIMRLSYYATGNLQPVRAEGWCMQGFAQVYQATGDATIKQYAVRRVTEVIEPQRKQDHASKALMFQRNYSSTNYPEPNEFFMPWQHGAVLYGFLGAYLAFEEPQLLAICEDVPTTVEYSWVTNVTTAQLGFVPQGLRYYVPATFNSVPVPASQFDATVGIHFGSNPLGGVHTFLIGGLHLLADVTASGAVRQKALYYGGLLKGQLSDENRWDKWFYCLPTGHAE